MYFQFYLFVQVHLLLDLLSSRLTRPSLLLGQPHSVLWQIREPRFPRTVREVLRVRGKGKTVGQSFSVFLYTQLLFVP